MNLKCDAKRHNFINFNMIKYVTSGTEFNFLVAGKPSTQPL